jgi:integrase/recombinase XerD
MAGSLHNYERKLEKRKELILKSDFSPANKKAILDFADHCFARGLSVPRVEKYVGHLKCLVRLIRKDFADATKPDIEALVRTIEQSDYADWTKQDLRLTVKKFYRWLRGTDGNPPETAWIKIGRRNGTTKLPDELLTEEDISGLIDACRNSRDRALVSMLYETGCRIGEIASMRIKHAIPHEHGFRIMVSGKTGTRRLLVVASAPYLTDWLNDHPGKSEPDECLWVSRDRRRALLSYKRISDILVGAAGRAGIKKRINPHSFRHSRATHLANHLTEAQMNEYFGWVQGSNMPSVYVHLSGRDVDKALLATYGIASDTEANRESRFGPRHCSRCNKQNAPTNRFCSLCGAVLDEETATEIMRKNLECNRADDIMDRQVQDSEFREMLQRKISELGADAARPGGGAGEPVSQTVTPSSHARLFLSCPSTSPMSGTGHTSRPSSFSQ